VIYCVIDFDRGGVCAATADPTLIEALKRGFEAQWEARNVYRPARELLTRIIAPNLVALHRILKANPWIHRRRPLTRKGKPDPNKVLVHAGDFNDYLRACSANPHELPEHVYDAVRNENREIEARQQAARRRKHPAE
jgi:hypothetical protein